LTTAAAVLALLSLLSWIGLLLFRAGFWRADQRFREDGTVSGPPPMPAVAAVVPARDEADAVGRSVGSLLAQDYPGDLRIVVVDDRSTDGTAAAVPADPRVAVVQGIERPDGWTGKLWAVSQGVDAAAASDFLWLTDADIDHAPGELAALVAAAEEGKLDLVSLMVKLHLETFWDRLLIPAFVFFFQKLYPFRRVNDPGDPLAAAAGGSMLVRRAALARIGGIAAIRNELIDDCALAARIKGSGGRIRLALAETTASLRAYRSLGAIWGMVARSAFHQLRYSPSLLAGTVVAMTLIYIVPPLAVVAWPAHGSWIALAAGAVAWVLMAYAEAPTLYRYGLNPWRGFALPAVAVLYTAMTVDSARRHWLGRGGRWKGRVHAP
jgi:hopene-associated glycosyltransferase HpnB